VRTSISFSFFLRDGDGRPFFFPLFRQLICKSLERVRPPPFPARGFPGSRSTFSFSPASSRTMFGDDVLLLGGAFLRPTFFFRPVLVVEGLCASRVADRAWSFVRVCKHGLFFWHGVSSTGFPLLDVDHVSPRPKAVAVGVRPTWTSAALLAAIPPVIRTAGLLKAPPFLLPRLTKTAPRPPPSLHRRGTRASFFRKTSWMRGAGDQARSLPSCFRWKTFSGQGRWLRQCAGKSPPLFHG